MTFNQILKELGFSKKDKTIIIHADDVGLNYSSIEAYEELIDLGTISSGSVMAHSSWLPEVVKKGQKNKDWDLGVHLAFNGEYETYKWRPLSTSDQASGFVDSHGYFLEDRQLVQEKAHPDAIEKELEAQIELAQNLGLDITHVDTHTGTLWDKKFIDAYIKVYETYDILPVIFKAEGHKEIIQALNGEIKKIDRLEQENFPMVDSISGLPVDHTYDIDERFELAKHLLRSVEPGKLVHFAFHPMKDSAEAQALNRYTAGRTGDFEVFRKPEMKKFLSSEGIQLIGYKEVAKALKKLKK